MSLNTAGSRTGVMLRSSTSPTADYLQLFYDSGTQYLSFYEQNSSGGDNPIAWQATTIPSWIRLKKDGTAISAWYSQSANPAWNNDADWTLLSSVSSSLYNGSYLLGIMAYNNAYGSNSLINESQLTNVSTNSLSGCTPPSAPSIAVTSTNLCQVQLTASGCAGTVNWSNGAVGTTIQVDTKNSVAYTATCTVSGCTSSSSNAITAPALPSGWTAQQIGTPPVDGCVRENSGTWTLRGSGNTYNTTDNFNYVYKTQSGNNVIVAKITSMSLNTAGSRTGVMLRSSTSPTADYLQLFYDSGTQYLSFYEQNSSGGDNPISWQATTIPLWIRLKKDGTTISAWYSQSANPAWNNDADWTLLSSVSSSLYNGSYLLGIMSYNNAYGSNSLINESQLTNVATYSLSGCTPPGAPSIAVTSTSTCAVQLTASGCAGTVNWSNGAVGTSIQVDTKNSVAYTATCTVSGCTSASSNAITAPALPSGWTAQQIGTPPVDGCVRENSGTWTLRGSGNTYNTTDNFNYVYKTHTGNTVIVAKITSMSANSPGTRTGVMLRSSTSPTADYLQLFYDSGTQYLSFYEQNSSGGDNPISWQATTIPLWIRLKKNGTTITAWYSQSANPAWNNDADWTLLSSVSSSLYNGSYLLGIMSYNNAYGSNSLINESQLTNVSTNTF
ncbi:hypothetical protein C0V77_10460 [Emticicia sp. TH156]|nr:hypothetical protein C0V77_10460 [Emticicia sp. TH156]